MLADDYLQHFDPAELIQKLEEWETVLGADPELVQRLRTIDQDTWTVLQKRRAAG